MNEWKIVKGVSDIMICGPGTLIITLKDFDREKVRYVDQGTMGESTSITSVHYPLNDAFDLELVSFRNSGGHSMVKMHLSDRVQWTLPEDFSSQLKDVLLGAGSY